jgi:hypothetical protein
MTATLYHPSQAPRSLPAEPFSLPNANGQVQLTHKVADALGCSIDMVEVLALGTDYVVYAVFASADVPNQSAVGPLFAVTGMAYGYDQDEEIPRGNVLVVRR